jgi:hypothetical protein
MEGSAEPFGCPVLQVGDWLDQQVLKQAADDMGIADREVEVPGRHIDASHRQRWLPANHHLTSVPSTLLRNSVNASSQRIGRIPACCKRISSRCREKFSKMYSMSEEALRCRANESSGVLWKPISTSCC